MKLKSTLWALAFACAAVSCSDDLENGPNNNGNDNGEKGESAKINVLINTGTVTKAIPGENGDDLIGEVGLPEESKVNDVTIILYNKAYGATDWKLTSGCALVAAGYTDNIGPMEGSDATTGTPAFPNGKMTTVEVKVADPTASLATMTGQEYGVIAVTNLGAASELADKIGKGAGKFETVGDLADALYADQKNGFVMSTHAIDGSKGASTVTLTAGDSDIPTTVAYVERLSAKIRITEDTNHEGFVYQAGNDEIILNNVAIVNQLNSNSYLLKRVSTPLTGTATDLELTETDADNDEIIGDEKGSTTEAATNFVIDPWTRLKTKGNLTAGVTNLTYKNRVTEQLYNKFWDELSNGSVKPIALDASKLNEQGKFHLCYTQENTTSVVNSLNGYSTGAIFQATYYPKKLSELMDVDNVAADITRGDVAPTDVEYVKNDDGSKVPVTFYTYHQDAHMYASFDAIFASIMGENGSNYYNFDDVIDAKKFKEALEAVKNVKDPFKYIETMVKESGNKTPTYKKISQYLSELEQSLNTQSPLVNTDDFFKEVKIYNQGQCFYPYWIRHADNQKATVMGVMEFGIVRNNIYDMMVTEINNLGLSGVDVIDPTDPDEDGSLRIQVALHVKNWVVRNNDNIHF